VISRPRHKVTRLFLGVLEKGYVPDASPKKTLFWGPILTGQFFSPENGFNMYSQTWTILPPQPQAVLFPAVASLVSAPLSESDRHRHRSCTHCRVRRSRIPHSFLQVGACDFGNRKIVMRFLRCGLTDFNEIWYVRCMGRTFADRCKTLERKITKC